MTNGFNDVGFLGDDLDSWRDNVRAEFPESFAIADLMNRVGMRMIREIPDGERPLSQVLVIAGFYRAFQSFQSAILLAERGALAEARALARLCCEAVIVTGGLLKVEGTVEKLHEDHDKHCLSMANSMIELNRQAETEAPKSRSLRHSNGHQWPPKLDSTGFTRFPIVSRPATVHMSRSAHFIDTSTKTHKMSL
jgi:hypothetical protein